jgi:hypothetical protein
MSDPDPQGHRGSMSMDNDPVFEEVGICFKCVERTSVRSCRAFPQGIPREILRGDVMHTSPYPGDNGIVFRRAI